VRGVLDQAGRVEARVGRADQLAVESALEFGERGFERDR